MTTRTNPEDEVDQSRGLGAAARWSFVIALVLAWGAVYAALWPAPLRPHARQRVVRWVHVDAAGRTRTVTPDESATGRVEIEATVERAGASLIAARWVSRVEAEFVAAAGGSPTPTPHALADVVAAIVRERPELYVWRGVPVGKPVETPSVIGHVHSGSPVDCPSP
ncbi:MAG TPA: hypothetical protein VD963_06950 [Phycisphaerales bacterium]|nr:hypothetical protein [Phycisphaerales bacterium]